MPKYLLVEIEKYRNEMIHLSSSNDLTSDVVIEISKYLDSLLNNLDKIKCNTENK